MAMTVVAVMQCNATAINIPSSAYAHPCIKPMSKCSWDFVQSSPKTRARSPLPPNRCSETNFFKGTLSLKCLKPRPQPCTAVGTSRIVAQGSDFADHEASKFREALLKYLAADQGFGDNRTQIVDTCTKIFRQFVMSYSGKLPAEPFVEMRYALEGQGMPLSEVGKVTRQALGWSRYNLYRDWKKWSTAN
eukprot:Gb_01498 [translate_table: standard]